MFLPCRLLSVERLDFIRGSHDIRGGRGGGGGGVGGRNTSGPKL